MHHWRGGAASVGLTLLCGLYVQTLAAATPQGIGPVHLALTFIRSNPVTTITVGGRTVQAVVDTGGGPLTLSKEILDSVGAINLTESNVSTDPFGREATLPRFRVPIVTIGDQTFRNMAAQQARAPEAGEGPPVPNGIGRELLSRYFVVVDYAHASITLWPPNTKNAASMNCGRTPIPMEHTVEDGLVVSDFVTQSGRIRLLLDTGATGSVLAEAIAEKRQLATTVRGPQSPKFYQSKMLSAAGQDFGPVEFVILPLKLPGDIDGMLGQNFFEHRVVCIDYKRREIRIH